MTLFIFLVWSLVVIFTLAIGQAEHCLWLMVVGLIVMMIEILYFKYAFVTSDLPEWVKWMVMM